MKSTRWQDKFLNHFTFLLFAFILLNAVLSFAGPSRTTYQAKIVKPDGYPLEAASVNFKFTILDPSGSCAIFAETYSGVNMTSTGGLISFSLGSGVKTFPVSGTTFEQIFSNITPNIACDTGGGPPAVYTPLANDARKILMQFHDGLGWQTLPAMTINAVPYAMYANDAQKFNGMIPSEFVQVSTIPTCTASEALRYTGSAFQCVVAGGSGSVSSGSVITALGYTPADSANLSTVSTYATNVSSTVFSVSSTVSSFQNTVAASFAAIVNSQWVNSGTAISYSAGRVGIGGLNTAYNFYLAQPVSGSTQMAVDAYSGTPGIYFRRANGTTDAPLAVSATQALMELAAVGYGQTGFLNSSAAKILMSADEDWTNATGAASIRFHTRASSTTAASIERMRIDKNGSVGIGTTTPMTKLDVSGGVRISMETAACAVSFAGTLRYNSGLVEYCNGTTWSAFGVAGAGITLLNGSSSGTQTFVTGISGANFNITTLSGVHTFNIPNAASAGVTAGLLSNTDYTTFANKVSATSSSVISALGYTPASATTVATLAAATAASFSAVTSSQWQTSGTTINYMTGAVGIGTVNPGALLDLTADLGSAANLQIYNTNVADGRSVIHFRNDRTTTQRYEVGIDPGGSNAKSFAIRDLTASGAPVRVTVASSGYVGIGTASPLSRLDLSANSVVDGSTITFSQLPQSTNVLLRTREYLGSYGWQLASAGGSQELFQIRDASGTPKFYINTSNNTIGIGAASATARLHITSGTASIPSLRFTVGNLVTTPQPGAMEYDATGFYLTDNSGIRRMIASGSSSGTIDNVSTINSTGNITMVPVGSVVVSGGLSVAGNTITPYLYGSTVSGGSLRIDSTTHASKGNILIAESGGYVGIGTATPTHPLHIYRNTTIGSGWGGGFSSASAALRIQESSGNGLYLDGNAILSDMPGQMAIGTLGSESLTFGTSNTQRMIIASNGEVGIGTSSPVAKLDVTGTNTQALLRLNSTSAAMVVGEDTDLPAIMRLRPTVGSGVAITGNNDTPGIYVYNNSYVAIGGDFIPTAALHVRAGTLSSAPLKFTSGSLMTTPQTGSMEFDGNSFYLTDNSGIRRAIATGTSSGAVDNASVINSSSNITLVPAAGSVIVSATTPTVNSATGALVVKGGVGIAGDANISGTVTATNAIMALSTGVVGIGASNPVTKLDVRSEGALKVARIQYSGTGFSSQPNLELHRSRGTIDAPTAVNANDTLGSISALGHNGTSFGVGSTAAIVFRAHQNYTPGSQGTYITFNTTASGTNSQVERMRLDNAGNLGLGVTNPTEKLEIAGTVKFAGSEGTFMYFRESTGTGSATADGARWSYEDDIFGTNNDGIVFEKTDSNASTVDGGFLFANRASDNIRTPSLAIRSTGVAVGLPLPGNARLAIASGTTAFAPLKFSTGSLNTTPQAGAMEYDGTNYYLTDSTGIRRNILWGSSSSPVVTNSTMQAVEFIATSSTITPYIYGSTASGGNLRIEASTASTKGAITLGMSGTTFVGIGVSAPLSPLHVVGGINPAMGTEDDDDGIVIQNFQPTLTFRDVTFNDPDDVRLRMDATRLMFETSPDFLTNSPVTTTLMTLSGSGNLGVGTVNPEAKLHIYRVGGYMPATSGTESNALARFSATNSSLDFGLDAGLAWLQATDRGNQAVNHKLLLNPNGGNVGIGTQNPTAALHILTSGTSTRGLRIVANASVAGAYAEAQFASDIREYRIGVGSASETAHNVPGKYYLYDGASNTMRLVIDTLGNIGAGTAAPITRFDVSRPTSLGSQLALRNGADSGFLTVPASTDGVILSTAKYDGANWITSSTQASAFTVGEGFIQMFTNSGLTPGASFSYTERARIDSQGNFLIGTTNSAHGRLAVESSGTAYLSLNTTNGAHKRSGVYFRSGGTPQMEIGVDAGVNGTRDFYIYDSVSGASRLHVNSNGYVGIGTGAPKSPLDVMGIIGTTWGTAFNTSFNGSWNQTTTGYAGLLQFEPATGKFYFWNTPATAAAGAANPFPVQSMTIDKDGKVGIGTASPVAKFHVEGDARINAIMGGQNNGSGNFHLDAWGSGADRSVYLNWASGTGGAKVGNGSSTWGPIAASAFNVSSDQRLKENIKPIQNPLEKILKIDAVTFTWKEASRRKMEGERIGLIAQNVEKVFPQAVKLDHSENALPGGTRLVNYPDLVSPIIAAIKEFYSLWVNDSKELHREIASVKEENEKLKLQNADKEKQLDEIRVYLCAKDPSAPICK